MDKLKKILKNLASNSNMNIVTFLGVLSTAIACCIGVGELLDNAVSNTGNPSKYVAWLVLGGSAGVLFFGVIRILMKRSQMRKLQETINSMSTVVSESNAKIEQIEERVQTISEKMENLACIPTRKPEERCHEIIINKLDEQSHFKYDTDAVTEELKEHLAKNTKINRLKIICYGRSGYQDLIRHIAKLNRDIRVELIMFNAEDDEFISRPKDKEYIDRHIKELKGKKKEVTVYVSSDPPMLRASALYEGDTPVWTAVQSYQLRYRQDSVTENGKTTMEKRLDLHRPDEDDGSLIIICDKKSSKTDFDGVIRYFNGEFDRLMSNSKEAILTKRGNIEYRERGAWESKGSVACDRSN
jgi:uncharacterized coiled-coil protein SlyX